MDCCTSPTWWKRVRHPSEVVEVGDEMEVRVLRLTRAHARLTWSQAALAMIRGAISTRRYPRRLRVCSARSPTLPTTAASSKSRTGSKAWFTVSEMTGPQERHRPRSCTLVRSRIMVLGCREERRRISPGLKAVCRQSWEAFVRRLTTRAKGIGCNQVDHRLSVSFIGLDGGIGGLVPGPLVRHFLDDAGRGIHSQLPLG